MSKMLFLNQPTVGHLNTLLTIALQMRDDGHEVHFLIPGVSENRFGNSKIGALAAMQAALTLPKRVQAAGLTVDTLDLPMSTFLNGILLPVTKGYVELMVATDFFTKGLVNYTRQVMTKLETIQPDMIVTDFAFLPGYLASELANLPCAVIYHSGLPFGGDDLPPFGSGLPIPLPNTPEYMAKAERSKFVSKIINNNLAGRINKARKHLGLQANLENMLDKPYSKWLNLITSHEQIEAPRSGLGLNTFFIGPCFSNRKTSDGNSDFPFDKLQPNLYKIYVSLGTVVNNRPKVFKKILSGLNHPDFQVIVSAGGSYHKLMAEKQPDNAMIFKSVPQVDLLPKVDFVIGHGGNNSTNETLAAGKPLLVLPVGGEQTDNGSRVEYLKVGKKLDIDKFSEWDIYQGVKAVKADPECATRLEAIRQTLAQTDGPRTASACIAWVAEHKQPLQRDLNGSQSVLPTDLPSLFNIQTSVKQEV